MKCKICGAVLNRKSVFCPNCGAKREKISIKFSGHKGIKKSILFIVVIFICIISMFFFLLNKRKLETAEFVSRINIFVDDTHTLYYDDGNLKPVKIWEDVYVFRMNYSGNRVAYLADLNEQKNAGVLYLYDIAKKNSIKIDENVYVGYICMSPDGKTISYVKDYKSCTDNKLYIAQGKNTPIQIEGGGCFPIAVSNDGNAVYYINAYNQMATKLFLRINGNIELLDEGIIFSCFYTNSRVSELLYTKNNQLMYYSQEKGSKIDTMLPVGEIKETIGKSYFEYGGVAKIVEGSGVEGLVNIVDGQIYVLNQNGMFEVYTGNEEFLFQNKTENENDKSPQLKAREFVSLPYDPDTGSTDLGYRVEYDPAGRILYEWVETLHERSYDYFDGGYKLFDKEYINYGNNEFKQSMSIHKLEENREIIFLFDEKNNFVEYTILEKDCSGNIISKNVYNINANLLSKEISTYNEVNLLMSQKTYDRQGHLTNVIQNGCDKDAEGNYVVKSYVNGIKTTNDMKYDSNGNLIGEGSIDSQGNIGDYYCEYKDGYLVKEYMFDMLNCYEYNKDGHRTKWYQGDRDSAELDLVQEIVCEYEYDTGGNVLSIKGYILLWQWSKYLQEDIGLHTYLYFTDNYTYY